MARFEELRAAGFESLYNLDYDTAVQKFREIQTLYPDHPAGPQFLAAALWSKMLNQSRRLQSSLYNSESFYTQKEDRPDPQMVEQFRALTKTAAQLAKARLRRNPKDVEALYFLGATEGLKAAFGMTVQRSFMAALNDGSSSVDRHREVIKLDPNFHDAELTIGLYDYVVGNLPAPVKLLASIVGTRGSKKRGLLTLQRVASEGRWAQDDAKSLLIVLFKREKRYDEALALARELGAKYPRNYLFKLEAADALVSIAGRQRQAGQTTDSKKTEREVFAIFDSLLHNSATRDTASRAQDLIHFRYGEALLEADQLETAAQEFLAAASIAGAESDLATMAHLRAAQAFDLAGKRDDALAQYRIVLGRPDVMDSHEEAKQGFKEPYKRKVEKSTED
ncbi:MAG TPA: tetratricopeptide repeat protein [Pyrinomonadaceae bacterium]|nr:tetratricopeptide repeat protein [Pyrinomonadaceae bacterium]